MKIVDLFRGPGGWSTGVRSLGLHDVGVEWDRAAHDTATTAGHEGVLHDVATLDPREFAAGVDGVIGSPPCQGFSPAGNGLGRRDSNALMAAVGRLVHGEDVRTELHASMHDPRSILALEPLRWTVALRPSWTAWEQVPTVLPLWQSCAQALREQGYSAWAGLLHAEQYGVPQTRKRAVLIASREHEVGAPTPTHSRYHSRDPWRLDEDVLPWVSIAQALNWHGENMPTVQRSNYSHGGAVDTAAGRGRSVRLPHEPSVALTGRPPQWLDLDAALADDPTVVRARGRLEAWAEQGWTPGALASGTRSNAAMRSLDAPSPTLAFGHDAASYVWVPEGMLPKDVPAWKRGDWVYRGSNQAHAARRPLNTPAPTVNFSERSNKVEWLPAEQAVDPQAGGVRVSVQEAAILQTFPADYPWQGNRSAQYRQVGDAVPPLLARHVVAEAIGMKLA